jgi:PIN domain nuclease of toxin-antitoxin system
MARTTSLRLLLDTHALIWVLTGERALAENAQAAIEDPEGLVAVSTVSAWEIEAKRAIGKLDAPRDLPERVAEARFVPLAITLEHAVAAGKLPLHHRDPFDRMLIAQAQLEGLTIVTRDPRFDPYAVATMAA